MSASFFLNEAIVIQQNTSLYAQDLAPIDTAFDYVFLISAGNAASNTLFNTRTYKQNSATYNSVGENNVDVNISMNKTTLTSVLSGSTVNITKGIASCLTNGMEVNTQRLLGLRFLEVLAVKIFGHAKARAAIANDTDFYSSSFINQIVNSVNSAVWNKRSDVFNAYVLTDRIDMDISNGNLTGYNDVDAAYNFNFANSAFAFPVYLNGAVVDPTPGDSSASTLSALFTGPNVGGNLLRSGVYNVPILFKFMTDA